MEKYNQPKDSVPSQQLRHLFPHHLWLERYQSNMVKHFDIQARPFLFVSISLCLLFSVYDNLLGNMDNLVLILSTKFAAYLYINIVLHT